MDLSKKIDCLSCQKPMQEQSTSMEMGLGFTQFRSCPECNIGMIIFNTQSKYRYQLVREEKNAKPIFPEEQVKAFFTVAGISVSKMWPVLNRYWGENNTRGPWWLVKTELGYIQLGWRKRVISIDWSDTAIRKIVTEDNVTKGMDHVHAYSEEDVVKYLKQLNNKEC